MLKKIFAFFVCAITLSCCGCSNNASSEGSSETALENSSEVVTADIENAKLTVSVINVKKADCILIQTENHAVLIDTATEDMSKTILQYLDDCGVQKLDYMIITHFHKDHCGSAAKIIKKLDVENVLQPDYDGTNDEYDNYLKATEKYDISPTRVNENYEFSLDDISFTVSPADKYTFEEYDENDRSLVTSVYCGEKSFLFAGDIDEARINEMLNAGVSHYDFLKVEHHGFYAENNADFIKAVSPEYAVISNKSEENADAGVFDALNDVGAKTFVTCYGTVKAVCDGKNIAVSYIE